MRFRAPILVKLLGALVLPVVALFTLFAFVAFEVSRHDLDDELGRRLQAIAASAATQLRDGEYLAKLSAGDETQELYKNVVARMQAVAKATGAHLIVLDHDFNSRLDTAAPEWSGADSRRPAGPGAGMERTSERWAAAPGMERTSERWAAGPVAIGTHDYRAELDRTELERVYAGETAASVTFQGNDGNWYKTGYAPIRATASDPRVVLSIGAQAPASYFDRLKDLKRRLFLWGAGLAGVSVLASVLATLLITRNVRRLAVAAERIGAGDLREPVTVRSRDELGVLGQTMDRMRLQLAERDAKMQQMLAGIAHEVRNPLAGMTLFAGILRDELPAPDERRSHVEKIQRELGYLERVVNDFLEYARRPKPEIAEVEVADLLTEVAQLATTAEIEVATVPTDLIVRADRSQLRRALLNLARNAVQAATAAGHRGKDPVALSVTRKDGELLLAVRNRGAEIPAETSGKLFEPFYTTREKGTGLGLAFVRDIAADHGGRVELHSADGETTFTLILPT